MANKVAPHFGASNSSNLSDGYALNIQSSWNQVPSDEEEDVDPNKIDPRELARDLEEDETVPDLLVVTVSCLGLFMGVGLAYGFFLFLVAIDVSPLYQALLMLGLLFGIALAGPCSIAIARKCCKI